GEKLRIAKIDKVAEEVELAGAMIHADFDSGHEFQPNFTSRCLGFRKPARGIVVRHGEGGEADLLSEMHELGRRARAVAGGGVSVEIDHRGCSRRRRTQWNGSGAGQARPGALLLSHRQEVVWHA